jgi:hypothetical protein
MLGAEHQSESAADPLAIRSRSRLYLPLALSLLAAGVAAYGTAPKPVTWKSAAGWTQTASYRGLGWTDRSDFWGRYCVALSSRKDDGSSEIVVDYEGTGWNSYRWYRDGRLWETGRMVIFDSSPGLPGQRWCQPKILLRILDNRKRVESD